MKRFSPLYCQCTAMLALVCAASLASAEDTYPNQSGFDTAVGNRYAAGPNIRIQTAVNGDLHAAGGHITLTQPVMRDATVAGGTIDLQAPVSEDVRAAGGELNFDSRIGGELFAAGGQIHLARNSEVAGPAMLKGGVVQVAGRIAGNLDVSGSEIEIDGQVAGNAVLRGEHIKLGPLAVIGGDLRYASLNPLQRDPASRVSGQVVQQTMSTDWNKAAHASYWFLWVLPFFLLGQMLIGASILLIWPDAFSDAALGLRDRPGRAMLFGMAIMLAVPPLIILLMVTIVGIPLGLILILLYPLSLALAYLTMAFALGEWVSQRWQATRSSGLLSKLLNVFIGLVLLALLAMIPLANVLIGFVVLSLGLGAWVQRWQQRR